MYLTGELHSVWTDPNSLLLILAGGTPHRVQPMKRGERLILKLLFARYSASLLYSGFANTVQTLTPEELTPEVPGSDPRR